MKTELIEIQTGSDVTTADITSDIARFCEGKGDGLVNVFLPHATAGIAIFETGAGSETDLIRSIDELWPAQRGKWHHEHGSAGHGRDHVIPAFISPSITIPVIGGRMQLGTWQSIVVIDTNVDNRTRKVRLSFVSG